MVRPWPYWPHRFLRPCDRIKAGLYRILCGVCNIVLYVTKINTRVVSNILNRKCLLQKR